MAPPSDLDSLKKKRDIINACIRLMQNREQSKERKDNTRRKILIGSYYFEQANKNNSFDSVVKLMDSYLTRDSDRMLFDLSPIKNSNLFFTLSIIFYTIFCISNYHQP